VPGSIENVEVLAFWRQKANCFLLGPMSRFAAAIRKSDNDLKGKYPAEHE
jgi:hypothetical protein